MTRQLSPASRNLAVIAAASTLWAFSFGIETQFAQLFFHDAGYDESVNGLNTATHYLALALAASSTPWFMRRLGRWCPLIGMVVSGLSVLLFPWGGGLIGWFALRFAGGVGAAWCLIPIETQVNQDAPPEHRSRNFGFYAVAIALGIAGGLFVGPSLYPHLPQGGFVLGGVIGLLGGVVLWRWLTSAARPESGQWCPELRVDRNLLTYGSAWAQGFLEGATFGHLAVYLLALGLTHDAVGALEGTIMVGVIAFQVPVAWFADRLGRTRVLLGCYAITAVALLVLPFCELSPWLVGALFLSGAASASFYPLGLSLLGEKMPGNSVARANARYLAFNCLGSLSGPALCGVAMDLFGNRAMFPIGECALVLVLGIWLWQRRRQTRPALEIPPPLVERRAA
jgi:MFS family permease